MLRVGRVAKAGVSVAGTAHALRRHGGTVSDRDPGGTRSKGVAHAVRDPVLSSARSSTEAGRERLGDP
jgi:hypothetical protein